MKKKISILIPTFNEEENIPIAYERIKNIMDGQLPKYDYEIVFIDNYSEDHSRDEIQALCLKDNKVKAIFNARNFGYSRSHYYGLTQMNGDAVMLIHADLQNPPELIPKFVKKWEDGAKVVIGIKNKSEENPFVYLVRSAYYKLMKHIGEVEQIEHFTDYELLDQSFIQVLKKVEDPLPYLRGIVSEYGIRMDRIYYTQEKRKHGKSWANFFKLYDFAMLGITSYSKALLRIATFVGSFIGLLCLITAIYVFIQKLLNWETYSVGIASLVVGVFFLGAVQLFFIGILGEYVLSINSKIVKRPLVVEERRINFDESEGKIGLSQ